jgi:hypothetical protein
MQRYCSNVGGFPARVELVASDAGPGWMLVIARANSSMRIAPNGFMGSAGVHAKIERSANRWIWA